jgi:hypothetical protein
MENRKRKVRHWSESLIATIKSDSKQVESQLKKVELEELAEGIKKYVKEQYGDN